MTTKMARCRKRNPLLRVLFSDGPTATKKDQSRGRSYQVLVNVDLPRGLVLPRIRRYCAAVSLSPGRSA